MALKMITSEQKQNKTLIVLNVIVNSHFNTNEIKLICIGTIRLVIRFFW